MWPFDKKRSADFWSADQQAAGSDYILNALVGAAQGAASPESVSAVETAAGTWSRALMSARVLPLRSPAALACTPELLGLIGRSLVRRGEFLAVIDVDADGNIFLLPASSWSVEGSASPESWRYRVMLSGPSTATTLVRGPEGVVHVRYGVEPSRPWRGLSPLQFAVSTGRLSGNLETRLADEAGGLTAYVVPVPQDGGSDKLDDLRGDIKKARGGTVIAETTAAGYGEGKMAAPQSDWIPRRIGANFPQPNIQLRMDLEACILAIHGVSPSLVQPNSDGTAQREAWRRFVFGTIEPVATAMAAELASKLDTPGLRFTFDALRANDLAGQSRSWRALVGPEEKMDPAQAAALVGFDGPED